MQKKLSEKAMADAFESLLKSDEGIKGFPAFQSVFREITCRQGIADFVSVTTNFYLDSQLLNPKNLSTESFSSIVSLLKPRSPRTEEFIMNSTGLSYKTIKCALKELEESGAIARTMNGSIILGPKWHQPKIELWAFELKLNNWKRALFQVLQYRAFANRVVIVLPHNKEKLIRKNIEIFKNLKVGVMTFNATERSYKIILRPLKSNPSSKKHNLFTLSQISTGDN